jgi:hypothetical protein
MSGDVSIDDELVKKAVEFMIDDDVVDFDPVIGHFLAVSIRDVSIRNKYKEIKDFFWPEHVKLLKQTIVEDEFYFNNKDMVDKTYDGSMKDSLQFLGICNFIIDKALVKQETMTAANKEEAKRIAKENTDKWWATSDKNPNKISVEEYEARRNQEIDNDKEAET